MFIRVQQIYTENISFKKWAFLKIWWLFMWPITRTTRWLNLFYMTSAFCGGFAFFSALIPLLIKIESSSFNLLGEDSDGGDGFSRDKMFDKDDDERCMGAIGGITNWGTGFKLKTNVYNKITSKNQYLLPLQVLLMSLVFTNSLKLAFHDPAKWYLADTLTT